MRKVIRVAEKYEIILITICSAGAVSTLYKFITTDCFLIPDSNFSCYNQFFCLIILLFFPYSVWFLCVNYCLKKVNMLLWIIKTLEILFIYKYVTIKWNIISAFNKVAVIWIYYTNMHKKIYIQSIQNMLTQSSQSIFTSYFSKTTY